MAGRPISLPARTRMRRVPLRTKSRTALQSGILTRAELCTAWSIPPLTAGREKIGTSDRKSSVAPRARHPYETIGTKIPASSNPYDVNGRGPLGDMADYMGSEGKQEQFWTTPETYDWLFGKFAPAVSSLRFMAAVPQRVVAYSGRIAASGHSITLEPWESYTDTVDIPDSTGTFTIRALDQNGDILATQALSVDFYVNTNPPRKLSHAPFQGTMGFPEGTTSFQIVENSTILKELHVNPTPPQIGNVTPSTPGTTVKGRFSIKWASSDAAKKPLDL